MKKCIIALLSASLCFSALTGCGSSGVSQEEYDCIVAEKDDLQNELLQYKELYENSNQELSSLKSYFSNIDSYVEKNVSVDFSIFEIATEEELLELTPGTLLYFCGDGGTGTYGLESWCILSRKIQSNGEQIILHVQPEGSFEDKIFSTTNELFGYGKLYALCCIKNIKETEERNNEEQSDYFDNTTKNMELELSAGSYIVGEDIPDGKYDIFGVEKGNIHVCSQGKDYGDIVNEIIVPGETVYSSVRLKDGDTVEIVLGGAVKLQPK